MPSIRILAIAAGWAIAVLGMPVTAPAQTIDTSAARATVGSPLRLTLRVRDFESGPAALGRDCLQADLRQGDAATPALPLRWFSSARAGEGHTWVTLTSAQAIEEPVLRIKVALLCGASFIREFTLLAEPPPPAQPVQKTPKAPKTQKAQKAASAKRPARHSEAPIPPAPQAPKAAAAVNQDPGHELAVMAMTEPSRSIKPLLQEPGASPHAVIDRATRTTVAPQSASPLTDAFVQLWQQDMQAVREDLRQSRAALASMSARLERAERDTWQLWGGLAALAAGLATAAMLWRVIREVRLRRFTRIDAPVAVVIPAPTSAHPDTPAARPLPVEPPASAHPAAPIEALPAPVPMPTSTPAAEPPPADTADPAETIAWDEPADNPPSRWSQADFGQPALDEISHTELLVKVDAMTTGGYHGASVAVLENALQSRVGKSAGILLRLLDLYRLLHQPWNHERVSAEIEAIYNVQVPSIEQAEEGRALDEHARTWQAITLSWGTSAAAEQLEKLLVRPTRIEVLDLAAFRDALMLHTMCTLQDASIGTGRTADSAAADPDDLPALPWLAQGAAA